MARTIYTVNSTQVVISESHPEGVLSVVSGYPKRYDSRNYDGNETKARELAEADWHGQVSGFLSAGNPNRVMWTVTVERSDGRQILRDSRGSFPAEPEPEPEEPEAEQEQ